MLAHGLHEAIFKPHSTRSAVTSQGTRACVPLSDILRHAGWSSHQTFNRFYNKPVTKEVAFAGLALRIDIMNLANMLITRYLVNNYGRQILQLMFMNSICLFYISCECHALKSHGIPDAVFTKQLKIKQDLPVS